MYDSTQLNGQALAEALTARFGRPCVYYPPMKDDGPILTAYQKAREQGSEEGFVPMLLSAEYAQGLVDGEEELPEQAPVLSKSGRDVLHRLLGDVRENYSESDWEEEIGEVAGGDTLDRFLSLRDFTSRQTVPVILAEIPVKNPWEVFACLPFGGWNECPDNAEQMAVAKYWFEEYGAVPGLMTQDVLEYVLPAPVPRARAAELALEQYVFCSDIVDQGVGTIGALADTLAQSDHWYFWWD